MKRLIYPLMAIMLFASCENEPLNYEQEALTGTTLKGKKAKVDVCHKGKIINISSNALNAHLKHGDVALIDYDGDGYVETENECGMPSGDCDDNDSTVYPGAEEICDGVDNNCDGIIDEEVSTTYYADSDGDGFGDPDTAIEACSETTGYVIDNSDCDDANSDINPGVEEICDNSIDDNCNGETDEGCMPPAAIGDEFQGGIVVNISRSWDNMWYGMVAAPTDIPNGATWYMANTLCTDLVLNGYDDWFLPTISQLNIMYTNRVIIGGFASGPYWSSSEWDIDKAYFRNFYGGWDDTSHKGNTYNVRAVRNFKIN